MYPAHSNSSMNVRRPSRPFSKMGGTGERNVSWEQPGYGQVEGEVTERGLSGDLSQVAETQQVQWCLAGPWRGEVCPRGGW